MAQDNPDGVDAETFSRLVASHDRMSEDFDGMYREIKQMNAKIDRIISEGVPMQEGRYIIQPYRPDAGTRRAMNAGATELVSNSTERNAGPISDGTIQRPRVQERGADPLAKTRDRNEHKSAFAPTQQRDEEDELYRGRTPPTLPPQQAATGPGSASRPFPPATSNEDYDPVDAAANSHVSHQQQQQGQSQERQPGTTLRTRKKQDQYDAAVQGAKTVATSKSTPKASSSDEKNVPNVGDEREGEDQNKYQYQDEDNTREVDDTHPAGDDKREDDNDGRQPPGSSKENADGTVPPNNRKQKRPMYIYDERDNEKRVGVDKRPEQNKESIIETYAVADGRRHSVRTKQASQVSSVPPPPAPSTNTTKKPAQLPRRPSSRSATPGMMKSKTSAKKKPTTGPGKKRPRLPSILEGENSAREAEEEAEGDEAEEEGSVPLDTVEDQNQDEDEDEDETAARRPSQFTPINTGGSFDMRGLYKTPLSPPKRSHGDLSVVDEEDEDDHDEEPAELERRGPKRQKSARVKVKVDDEDVDDGTGDGEGEMEENEAPIKKDKGKGKGRKRDYSPEL